MTVSPKAACVSLYRHPTNGVLAAISNLGGKRTRVKVRFDLEALGLTPQGTATLLDPAATGQETPVDLRRGSVELALDSLEWRLLWMGPS